MEDIHADAEAQIERSTRELDDRDHNKWQLATKLVEIKTKEGQLQVNIDGRCWWLVFVYYLC